MFRLLFEREAERGTRATGERVVLNALAHPIRTKRERRAVINFFMVMCYVIFGSLRAKKCVLYAL
jgi:hypothetical protein